MRLSTRLSCRTALGLCRSVLGVVAVLTTQSRPAHAQIPASGGPLAPSPFVSYAVESSSADQARDRGLAIARLNDEMRRRTANSHWLTGGLIGAGVLGVAAAAVTAGLCDSDSGSSSCTGPVILAGVVGAGVGMAVGALIGGNIPKKSPEAAAP